MMSLIDALLDRVARFLVSVYTRRKRSASGFCLIVEAVDGAGKSTQLKMIIDWLKELGVRFTFTREPGGTPEAERIRDLLLEPGSTLTNFSEAYLFAASRVESVTHITYPALQNGIAVMMDRHVDSSIVYQGFGRGLKTWFIRMINIFGTIKADLRIIILVDWDVALSRQKLRDGSGDRFEQATVEFKRRLDAGYRWLAKTYPKDYVVVDGNGSPDEVFRQIKAAIVSRKPEWAD